MAETRSKPSKQNCFAYEGRKKVGKLPRIMTVIRGIPFYLSSGRNSSQPNTWLPQRGIEVNGHWIIKPKQHQELPAEIINFFKDNEIEKEIALNRLGTIETMCYSASIGGGFWDTAKGNQLCKRLKEKYEQLFLDLETADHLRSMIGNTQLPLLNNYAAVNAQLQDLGAVIPLNQSNNRLPNSFELEVMNHPLVAKDSKIRDILSTLITTNSEIDEKIFTFIQSIANNSLLIDYILHNHMLEDADQLREMMALPAKDITLAELEKINKFSMIDFDNYNHLTESYDNRFILRSLIKSDQLSNDKLGLTFKTLLELKDLILGDYIDIKLLSQPRVFSFIAKLVADDSFKPEHLLLIRKSNQLKLLEELFTKNNLFLSKLIRCNAVLIKENANLIKSITLDLIPKATPLLRNKSGKKALQILADANALSERNIDLLIFLHNEAALKNSIDYLLNSAFIDEVANIYFNVAENYDKAAELTKFVALFENKSRLVNDENVPANKLEIDTALTENDLADLVALSNETYAAESENAKIEAQEQQDKTKTNLSSRFHPLLVNLFAFVSKKDKTTTNATKAPVKQTETETNKASKKSKNARKKEQPWSFHPDEEQVTVVKMSQTVFGQATNKLTPTAKNNSQHDASDNKPGKENKLP